MAIVPVLLMQDIPQAGGVNPTFAAADVDGNSLDFGANADWVQELVHIQFINGSASALIITLITPETAPGGRAIEDTLITIPAGETKNIRPYPRTAYGTVVTWTYSFITTVTYGVFQLVAT